MVSHQLIGLGNWLHLCTCESMYVFFHIHVCVQSFCVCAYLYPATLNEHLCASMVTFQSSTGS